MNDFLSKFSGEKYEDMIDPGEKAKENTPSKETYTPPPAKDRETARETLPPKEDPPSPKKTSRHAAEDTVTDPSYRKKQRQKIIIGSVAGLVILSLLYLLYYNMTRVSMPDFVNKQISEARQWGSKNSITFNTTPIFDSEVSPNYIITQSIEAGKKVKKGSFVEMNVSKGADPDEKVPLPDFSQMDMESARMWIEEHKADNLSLIRQFNETIDSGKFIKLELSDKSIKPEDYRRKDNAILYYSKGQEILEKNITVPNFKGKTRMEVETWSSSNEISLTVSEAPSESVESGHVIEQSINAGEKVAKKDALKVTVSQGKGITVPNFSDFTAESAATISGLQLLILQRYSESIPYGSLISQSISPGTKLTERDDKSIQLVYSLGQPYIKDLRGTVTESELQKYFFDEFRSKGASIGYKAAYIASDEPRGTIVTQSVYSTLLPMRYTVRFGISRGPNYVGDEPETPGSLSEDGVYRPGK